MLRRGRKLRAKALYDRAMVALLAGENVEQSIATIAEIMHTTPRASDRIRAAVTLIELACGQDVRAENHPRLASRHLPPAAAGVERS